MALHMTRPVSPLSQHYPFPRRSPWRFVAGFVLWGVVVAVLAILTVCVGVAYG